MKWINFTGVGSLLCTFFAMTFSASMQAQGDVCEGNLGENIFILGDFGTGAANILSPNPNIAPGYTYTFNGPPNDGFYTVTNNTGAWGGLFPTWLRLRDNSDDLNGYMMVVNASFSPGNFYDQVVDGLCENTLYEFSTDVINLIRTEVANHIRPNVTFLLDEVVQITTGDIPQDETWTTYGFTFTTGPNQTSLRLTLRNNAPGGVGNDLALDNISFRACGPQALILPTEIANICEDGDPIELEATIIGDQYSNPTLQWQQSFDEGLNWQDITNENGMTFLHSELSAGDYYYRYLLANSAENLQNGKCRVISNQKIVRVVPKLFNIADTLCQGLFFTVGTSEYGETGIYTDSLISSIGCDSIVTLDLTIVPDMEIRADAFVKPPSCFGFQDASLTINNIENTYPPYFITFQNEAVGQQGNFENLGSGSYLYSITDRYGCNFQQQVNIFDPAQFILELGEDLSVDLGDEVQLNVSANYDIAEAVWAPDGILNCSNNCQTIEVIPTTSQNYVLTATSLEGCIATDSIFIQVNIVRKVYFPNAFSPNDDGINDYFSVYGDVPNVLEIEELLIFDRWGELMFEGKNLPPDAPSVGWDGSFKGEDVNTGVYVYIAKVKFFDELTETFSGDVLLLR